MADAPKNDPFFETIMATLRANVGSEILDVASPDQTMRQRSTFLQNAADVQTLKFLAPGDMPTIVRPAGETDMPGLVKTKSSTSGVSSSSSHSSDSLARWSEFTIHTMVGKGGMGEVFLAGQNALRREVAIKKIIPERLEKSTALKTEELFISEALVMGFLDHPNIVPVYALGRDEDGKWFFSMKMVRGMEWRQLLHPARCKDAEVKAKALERNLDIDDPVRRAAHLDDNLRILQSVCNAVAFAHSKKVIHRDLKPENVMVGSFGEVLVMDWGLAVDVSEAPPAPGSLEWRVPTRDACGMGGTPAYMGPEQIEFDPAGNFAGTNLDRWTDVFLLGAMLHELLTGAPPWAGPTLNEVFLKISQCAPPHFPDSVPAEMAAICRKALAKNPRERYVDALAFQQALQEFLKHREAAAIAAKAEKEARIQEIPHLARAVVLYDQALELWPENEQFRDAVRITREALAQKEIKARLTRLSLYAAVACILLGLTVGFFWIRAEQKKAENALKLQTQLSFEAVLANSKKEDNYEHAIQSLDAFLSRPELAADKKFLEAQQLRAHAQTFIDRNRGLSDKVRAGAKTIEIYLTEHASLELLRIPEGQFKMGSPENEANRYPDESPQHSVSISTFYMGKFDVTQEQYEAVTGDNPSAYAGPKNPVESLSWFDAAEYCNKLNLRLGKIGIHVQLPTEAQWEYACRAGTTTRFYFGDKDEDLGKFAWYKVNSYDTKEDFGPHPVGLKPPNAFGLYDMAGNVSQWCQDWYDSQYYEKSPPRDPKGPETGEFQKQVKGAGRILRGGAWDDEPRDCRSANREYKAPGYRSFRRGFRVVITQDK